MVKFRYLWVKEIKIIQYLRFSQPCSQMLTLPAGKQLPTFRTNVMPSYVGPRSQTLIVKEKRLISVETSETIYHSTRRNIPDDLSLQDKITITRTPRGVSIRRVPWLSWLIGMFVLPCMHVFGSPNFLSSLLRRMCTYTLIYCSSACRTVVAIVLSRMLQCFVQRF